MAPQTKAVKTKMARKKMVKTRAVKTKMARKKMVKTKVTP
jgi:hypothetical protein